jgi:hypothetical protein
MSVRYETRVIGNVIGYLDAYLDEVAKSGGKVISVIWLPRYAPDGPGFLVVSEHGSTPEGPM